MQSFQWDSYFMTGLPTVDEQHRHLVDVINRFGALIVHPEGAGERTVDDLFGELAEYAQYHFHEEEKLMESAHLDARYIAHHRQEHAQFLLDAGYIRTGLSHEGRDEERALLNFLINWLAYHILGSDRLMAEMIAATNAGVPAETAYTTLKEKRDPATAALLQAMDGLVEQLSRRNREMYELNRTLEARVAERTNELSAANLRLEELAMTDVLTGLPNRRHAMSFLNSEWCAALADATTLACMMIDADNFKTINDAHGHDAGDEVLRRLATCLQHAVRTDDKVFRLGGDEFLIVCPRTPLGGALQLAEVIRKKVGALHVVAGSGVWHGSISVGVAVSSPTMNSIEDLLKLADEGVYLAKRNGRNCVATACSAPAQ